MLALTKKTDYALIALAHLAQQVGSVVSARELGLVSRVPLPILTNILKTLAQAGFVTSERGAAGGYALARSASSITLHELIQTIEGPFHLVQCVPGAHETHREPCELEPCCSIRKPAHRVHDRMREFLESVTLEELVDGPKAGIGVPLGVRVTSVKELAS
jgi:Rrf2 family protein